MSESKNLTPDVETIPIYTLKRLAGNRVSQTDLDDPDFGDYIDVEVNEESIAEHESLGTLYGSTVAREIRRHIENTRPTPRYDHD